MGMYTELVLKCEIKNDAPKLVKDILEYLFNRETEEPIEKPEHKFFECERWRKIGACSSYYHIPFSLSKIKEGYVFSRSDLKNYDGEIKLFIDWLKPYIYSDEGTCIGWEWYEEAETPTLLYV